MAREITLARRTWDLLKPVEVNADTINVERHLPSQFQLLPPKLEGGILFRPSYGNILSAASVVSPLSPDTEIASPNQGRAFYQEPGSPDPTRSTPQSSLLPGSPGFRQRLDTPRTDFSRSENLSSIDGAGETTLQPEPAPPDVASQSQHKPSVSTVSFDRIDPPQPLLRNRTIPSIAPPKEKSRWKKFTSGSRKESFAASIDTSSLSSTTLESQRLDEISLKSLSTTQRISVRGRSAKNINVYLSQNSTYALFWTQPYIQLWDVGASPPAIRREVSTDGTCVLAAVTKVHLAYIVGTRDQKLTVKSFPHHRNLRCKLIYIT